MLGFVLRLCSVFIRLVMNLFSWINNETLHGLSLCSSVQSGLDLVIQASFFVLNFLENFFIDSMMYRGLPE